MTVQKRVGLIASVTLLVAAVMIYVLTREESDDDQTFNARLQCLACQAQFGARLDIGDPPPFECDKCGKVAAWRMKLCRDCGLVFTPDPEGDPPRQPMIPTCPQCKGQKIGSAPLDVP